MIVLRQTVQRKGLMLLSIMTVVAMIYSTYTHLDYVAQGIQNLRLADVFVAWPVWFLCVSASLLIVSVFVGIRDPHQAAKLAFFAAIIGWGYYGFAVFFLFLPILFFFWKPDVLLSIIIPCVLLALTTSMARRDKR